MDTFSGIAYLEVNMNGENWTDDSEGFTTPESEQEVVSAEQAKKAKEDDLLPTGNYPGVVVKAVKRDDMKQYYDDGAENPLYGKTVYNVRADLTMKRPDGSLYKKPYFFEVTPSSVVAKSGKLVRASANAGKLALATETVGQAISKAFERAQEMTLWFKISLWDSPNGPRNLLNDISAKAPKGVIDF